MAGYLRRGGHDFYGGKGNVERAETGLDDLSEGGLAVAIAEMAFAGGLGAELDIADIKTASQLGDTECLFSESNSRLLVEVASQSVDAFEDQMNDSAIRLGTVQDTGELAVSDGDRMILNADIQSLKNAWLAPLDWK